MGKICLLLISTLITSCTFTTVDFKYTSNSHQSFRSAISTIQTPPEILVSKLSSALRQHGAIILIREKIPYNLQIATNADKCWQANRTITLQEFASFSSNDYSQYKKIDRKAPFINMGITQNCQIFDEIPTQNQSWLLMAQFPSERANTTIYKPTSSNFFIADGKTPPIHGFISSTTPETVEIDITTRLYMWAWEDNDGNTKIYLEGRPFSGQIEASNGNSIGWRWWKISNGYKEAEVVKTYILLLQDYDQFWQK